MCTKSLRSLEISSSNLTIAIVFSTVAFIIIVYFIILRIITKRKIQRIAQFQKQNKEFVKNKNKIKQTNEIENSLKDFEHYNVINWIWTCDQATERIWTQFSEIENNLKFTDSDIIRFKGVGRITESNEVLLVKKSI
jgi:ABC-type bacteriocin/lantibiotic exporter with double-glycine peptidase domain